jgi:hypothetical protein
MNSQVLITNNRITLYNHPPCHSNHTLWEPVEPVLKHERALLSGMKECGNKVQCGGSQSQGVLSLGSGMGGLVESPHKLCQQRGNACSPGGC